MQKDTILLNYCIDDIETMCRQLRESRSGVGSDGPVRMLEDYKATDFISMFQKFKLAFNLLVSQLKSTKLEVRSIVYYVVYVVCSSLKITLLLTS